MGEIKSLGSKRKALCPISENAELSNEEFALDEQEFLGDSDCDQQEDENSDDSGGVEDVIDVDFEFYPFKQVDFHGLKTLLSQGFSDAEDSMLNLSELADAIIANEGLGSAVKTDGEDGDPFAIVTLLHPLNSETGKLLKYFRKKIKSGCIGGSDKGFLEAISDSEGSIAYLVSERLINMPAQLSPPLYQLLEQDFKGKPGFEAPESVLYMAKMWRETLPADSRQHSRKKSKLSGGEAFYFNAEDQLLEQTAEITVDYSLPQSQVPDSRRVFSEAGMEPFRRLMKIPWTSFLEFVTVIQSHFKD